MASQNGLLEKLQSGFEVPWKYNEPTILEEIHSYCADTYMLHYAQGNIEASEYIADQGLGEGFFLGNAIKYLTRYGRKDGRNKKDLLKAIHYTMMAINEFHYKESEEEHIWWAEE